MKQIERVEHPFAPVYNSQSRVLIVGTFPSVKSRQEKFYYANPHNRFYRVLAALFEVPVPESSVRETFLLDHHVAVFDVLQSCFIHGSSDASIRRPEPNDFSPIFEGAQIRRVFANGRTAARYYEKYISSDVTYLPSTSPANASFSMERLVQAWSVILPYLK